MICTKQTADLYAAIKERNVEKAEESIRGGAEVNFYDRHQRDIPNASEADTAYLEHSKAQIVQVP